MNRIWSSLRQLSKRVLSFFRKSPPEKENVEDSDVFFNTSSSLPSDIWDQILDYAFIIDDIDYGVSASPCTASTNRPTSPASLRKQLHAARKTCSALCLTERASYEVAKKRLCQMMLTISSTIHTYTVPPNVLWRLSGDNNVFGQYVQRFELYYEVLTDALASDAERSLNACTRLQIFRLRVQATTSASHLHLIMSALERNSAGSIRVLECYLPCNLSHLPYQYLRKMANLRICILASSKNQYSNPTSSALYTPINTHVEHLPLSFAHLHTVRFLRAELLVLSQEWDAPNLEALWVDHEHPYDFNLFMRPFLYRFGRWLTLLDLYYIGECLQFFQELCPNLREAIFDIRGYTLAAPEPGVVLHDRLSHIGLRGCPIPPLYQDVRWHEILATYTAISVPGNYPALAYVRMLDFSINFFETMTNSPFVATRWLVALERFTALGIPVIDANMRALSNGGLEVLNRMAAGENGPHSAPTNPNANAGLYSEDGWHNVFNLE